MLGESACTLAEPPRQVQASSGLPTVRGDTPLAPPCPDRLVVLMFTTFIAVAGFGAAGAVLRWQVASRVRLSTAPWLPLAIFCVNMSGCLLLGFILVGGPRLGWPPWLVVGSGVGGVGAYTTYSTWANDTTLLWRDEHRIGATANAVVSVAAGVLLAALGAFIGRAL